MDTNLLLEASFDLQVNYHNIFVEQLTYELNEEEGKTNIFQKLKEALISFGKMIMDFFKNAWRGITDKFKLIKKIFINLINKVKGKKIERELPEGIDLFYIDEFKIDEFILHEINIDFFDLDKGNIEKNFEHNKKRKNINESSSEFNIEEFQKKINSNDIKLKGFDIIVDCSKGMDKIDKEINFLNNQLKTNITNTNKLIQQCNGSNKEEFANIERGKSVAVKRNSLISKAINMLNKIAGRNLTTSKKIASYYN